MACATTKASCRSIPQLPDGISRLRFRLRWRGFRLTVDVDHTDVTYTLRDGPDGELTIRHAGEELTLSTDSPSTIALRHPRAAAAATATAAGPRADTPAKLEVSDCDGQRAELIGSIGSPPQRTRAAVSVVR